MTLELCYGSNKVSKKVLAMIQNEPNDFHIQKQIYWGITK